MNQSRKKNAQSVRSISTKNRARSLFTVAIVAFACLVGHQCHTGLGKGNTTAPANSFQAREGATGVIGHNLVDSLIYKQSLMKFLVFINNALQPRAPVCRHRYSGIPLSPSPSRSSPPLLYPSIFLLILRCRRFRAYHRPTPFIALAFNQPLLLATTGVSWINHRVNMFFTLL